MGECRLREALSSNTTEALKDVAEGLELPQGIQGANLEAGLAYAMISDNGRAQALADRLDKRYLLDTQVQSLWLPPFVRN